MLQVTTNEQRPTVTVNLCSTIMDANGLRVLQQLGQTNDLNVIIPNANHKTHLSQDARIQLFRNIANTYGLNITLIEKSIDEIKSNMNNEGFRMYASDTFKALDDQPGDITKMNCYERSIAYMVGWYFKAIENGNRALEEKMKKLLGEYVGDHSLAKTYLDNAALRNDAAQYLESLEGQRAKTTIDNIIMRENGGSKEVLLGYRGHFPTGRAGMGGFIDKEDTENATKAGIPSATIYAALREGVEELGGKYKNQESSRTFGTEQTKDGEVYYVTQGELRLEIRKNEILPNNIYQDDVATMEEPTDPRGLVSTTYFTLRIIAGEPQADDDVANIKWVKVEDILQNKVDFVMPHHHFIYNKVLSSK